MKINTENLRFCKISTKKFPDQGNFFKALNLTIFIAEQFYYIKNFKIANFFEKIHTKFTKNLQKIHILGRVKLITQYKL